MRIILLSDVGGLGKKFDVKDAKDGYARNFLLPRGLAQLADPVSLRELESKKAYLAREEGIARERLTALADRLEKEPLVFRVKTGPRRAVYGSVTKGDIEEKIAAMAEQGKGKDLVGPEVILLRPLKIIGEHNVAVRLGYGVTASVRVVLEASSEDSVVGR